MLPPPATSLDFKRVWLGGNGVASKPAAMANLPAESAVILTHLKADIAALVRDEKRLIAVFSGLDGEGCHCFSPLLASYCLSPTPCFHGPGWQSASLS